jgi:hypothetical protein
MVTDAHVWVMSVGASVRETRSSRCLSEEVVRAALPPTRIKGLRTSDLA